MSETETIYPLINTNIKTEKGISIALFSAKGLSVSDKHEDGIKQVYMYEKGVQIDFFLNQDECHYLAKLLTE